MDPAGKNDTLQGSEGQKVDIDAKLPGQLDEETGAVTFSDDSASYGVLDEIARRVMLTRGEVLAVRKADVPDAPVAAIFRHSL